MQRRSGEGRGTGRHCQPSVCKLLTAKDDGQDSCRRSLGAGELLSPTPTSSAGSCVQHRCQDKPASPPPPASYSAPGGGRQLDATSRFNCLAPCAVHALRGPKEADLGPPGPRPKDNTKPQPLFFCGYWALQLVDMHISWASPALLRFSVMSATSSPWGSLSSVAEPQREAALLPRPHGLLANTGEDTGGPIRPGIAGNPVQARHLPTLSLWGSWFGEDRSKAVPVTGGGWGSCIHSVQGPLWVPWSHGSPFLPTRGCSCSGTL